MHPKAQDTDKQVRDSMTTEEIKNLTPDQLLLEVKKEYEEGVLADLIRKGGKKVSEENGDQRILACHGCDYLGKTRGYIGCTICTCPFASKAYMKNLLHIKAECPHPEGSRWTDIDNKF